jgi:hypothetical protein
MACKTHGRTSIVCPDCDAEIVRYYELMQDYPLGDFRCSITNKRSSYDYVVKINSEMSITQKLGSIRETNDGRFRWIRHSPKHKFHEWSGDNAQGCEPTCKAAMIRVLEGWL